MEAGPVRLFWVLVLARHKGSPVLQEAKLIAEEICSHRVRASDGSLTWIGPSGYGTEVHPLRITKLGPNLYDGSTGIALFLAAAGKVLGEAAYCQASLSAIDPLRRKLRELLEDPRRASQLKIPIGGLMGLGSFIFGFLAIGEILEEDSLLEEAHAITCHITPERIASDDRVRVQTGSAGAILALRALHQRLPGRNQLGLSPLDLASACASHLLAHRISFDGRPKAWPLSPGKPPLGGFCYGAAGASFALLRLHQELKDEAFWSAAQEGLAFIDGLYSPQDRSWRDARSLVQSRYNLRQGYTWKDWWALGDPDSLSLLEPKDSGQISEGASVNGFTEFPATWCHGSAGIVLARMALLDVIDDPLVREDISSALERLVELSLSHSFVDQDDLCCGYAGRIEVLLYAARKLEKEEYYRAAVRLMERVFDRARESGGYRVSAARGTRAFSPALFQGIAGIGYTILRLAEPETLPCILLLD